MNTHKTDAYFHIGAEHLRSGLPCEDYALAEAGEHAAYAIVSDGCSSGGRTDVGARVLAHMTARSLRHMLENEPATEVRELPELVRMRTSVLLDAGRELLALDESDLLATSLVAYVQNETGYINVEGDGVIARVYCDGTLVLSSYSWDDNMPYYPSYAQGMNKSFVAAHGYDLDMVRLREAMVTVRGSDTVETTHEYTLRQGMQGVHIALDEAELQSLRLVAVFSDGVTQIDGVSWVDAVQQFLAFKSAKGAFVKRRMIRQLKTYDRDGTVPQDDIAAAVIQINHENGGTQ